MKQVFNIISTEIIVVKCNSKKLFFVKQQEVKIYVVNEFDIKYEFKQQTFLLYKTQKEFKFYFNEKFFEINIEKIFDEFLDMKIHYNIWETKFFYEYKRETNDINRIDIRHYLSLK